MKENKIDMWFGSKNVLQNNSSMFEMRAQGWRGLLAVAVLLFAFGVIAFGIVEEEPQVVEMIKSEETREVLYSRAGEFIDEFPKEGYIAVAIAAFGIIFGVFVGFTRVAYIRIDSSQMIIGNALDHRLGRPGNQYIVAPPATLVGKIKGHGNNKRLELTLTTSGGEVKKIKLYGQAFGNKGLQSLQNWLQQNRSQDY